MQPAARQFKHIHNSSSCLLTCQEYVFELHNIYARLSFDRYIRLLLFLRWLGLSICTVNGFIMIDVLDQNI